MGEIPSMSDSPFEAEAEGTGDVMYFAYGSNMDPEQMKTRCPNAELVGIGVMENHVLCFPRRSVKRNCGVSSVAPLAGHKTWGVVYRLTSKDLAALDGSEGFRSDRAPKLNSYNRVGVIVSFDDLPTDMVTYVAVAQEDVPLPNAAYLKHIREGARYHSLPAAYLEHLEGIEHLD